ncbi:glycoside hydrolase [Auricularia subglabra TFB-10046 SS5]|nr:glycoside hydrolase [Auricularia subglabra TFB-10046 SS5]
MANNNTVVPHEFDDQDLSKRFNDWVHKVNPSCTTAFSVGGWTMTDGPSQYTGGVDYSTFFSQMAASAAGRQTFINSCIDWARTYGFDGVDIDWEYVGDPARGGGPADTENFTKLMQEMRAAFQAEASSSGKRELLITVAGPADPAKFALIQAQAVSQYIDWYNVMLYDFYGNWDDFVEVNAPISDTITPTWSFSSGLDLYLNAGVSPSKLYAGLPLYGRVWTLSDPSRTAPGSPGSAGTAGPCTAQPGYLGYFEIDNIRQALRSQNLENQALQFVPGDGYYLVFDNQWVGFDDALSFQAKLEIVNDRGIAGTMARRQLPEGG